MSEVYEGLKNNLELYRYLVVFPLEQRQPEYARIVSKLSFKVKSFKYVMEVGARVDGRN